MNLFPVYKVSVWSGFEIKWSIPEQIKWSEPITALVRLLSCCSKLLQQLITGSCPVLLPVLLILAVKLGSFTVSMYQLGVCWNTLFIWFKALRIGSKTTGDRDYKCFCCTQRLRQEKLTPALGLFYRRAIHISNSEVIRNTNSGNDVLNSWLLLERALQHKVLGQWNRVWENLAGLESCGDKLSLIRSFHPFPTLVFFRWAIHYRLRRKNAMW